VSAARTVHLLRHGTTVRPGRWLGHADVAVDAQGIADCVRVAAAVAFTHIVTSDLARARDCGAAIAEARAGPTAAPAAAIRVDPRWRELDFGDWDDTDPATLDAATVAAFWRDPDTSPPPNGERWSTLVTRVAAALADVPGDTLVVTHGGTIRAALAATCGFDARQVWAFDLPCAALLTLRLWPDAAQIVRLRA
jgi:alpha-ribazole phosphatase